MNELRRQNRPSRFKKVALVLAVLVGLILAGGGIAMAAGYNPIELFFIIHSDGTGAVYYLDGNAANANLHVEQGEDGLMRARVTLPDNNGEVHLKFAPNETGTVILSKQPDKDAKPIPPAPIGQKK